MRIRKGSHGAVVILGRSSAWTAPSPDGRDLHDERQRVRAAAEAFCRRHHLRSYQVVASAVRGGYTVDDVQLVAS